MKRFEYTFQTHLGGQDRGAGQPYFHANNLFMVVEGVGGEYLGELAREHAYRIIPEIFFSKLSEYNSPGNAMIDALEEANKAIITERKKLGEKMAASVSLIFIRDKIMYFTHLGDSRVYSFQGGELNQLTKDHTLKEEDPFAENRVTDPRALHALTKGLGIHEDPSIEVKKYPLHEKGLILMTTDGLTEKVTNREMLWLLKKIKGPKKLAKRLIDLARRKGGESNITVGILKFGGLTRGLRNILLAYSAVFLVVLAVIGAYLLNGSEEPAVKRNRVTQSEPAIMKKKIVQPQNGTRDEGPASGEKAGKRAPESGETPRQSEAELFKSVYSFIAQWKTAWENTAGKNGDIETYISLYSKNFKGNRLDKEGWKQDKARKGKEKQWIRIGISNIKISEPTDDNRVEVRFRQDYRSSNFSVRSDKLLFLSSEGSKWRIIHEASS